MGKNILKGEEHFVSTENGLKEAVAEFNTALATFGLGVAFELGPQTFKEVQNIRKEVQGNSFSFEHMPHSLIVIQICDETLRRLEKYRPRISFVGRL